MIRYAGDFVPAWAGAIAIDLLPPALAFIIATSQAAIRHGRGDLASARTPSVADPQAALTAMCSLEGAMDKADRAMTGPVGMRPDP